MFRRLRFDHIHQLDQQGTDRQCLVFQQGNCTAAGIAGQDQIQAVADNRVFPTDELGILTRQGLFTIEGDGTAVLRQTREVGHQHVVGRRQNNQVVAAIVLVDADDIEQVKREAHQIDVVVLIGNGFRQRLRFLAAVGVHFQQAVTALLELHFQVVVLLAAGVNELVQPFLLGRRSQESDQLLVAAVVNGTAGRAGMLEGIEPFVEPAAQNCLSGVLQVRHHDLNVMHLADTVQTANTLFQQVRVERQVEHHQMAGELEVTAFGADLGTQQHLGTVFFGGEVSGGAVAFDNRQAFVEHGGTDSFTFP